MALDSGEYNGKLYGLLKGGASAKIKTGALIAAQIVTDVYDTERVKGEHRTQLANAIEQALRHYKGDI